MVIKLLPKLKGRNILYRRKIRELLDDILEKQRYLLDPQEAEVKQYCAECGGELYNGDIALYDSSDDLYIHEECLEDYVQNMGIFRKTVGEEY